MRKIYLNPTNMKIRNFAFSYGQSSSFEEATVSSLDTIEFTVGLSSARRVHEILINQ
jgi:hypothetical protein